jgi:hypothetical protein
MMRMFKLGMLVALLGFGCGESVKVSVNCLTVQGPAVECDVSQTLGKGEVEACWDFEVTCGNGEVVKAPRTCQKVKDGGTAKATIPGDKLANVEKCGGEGPVGKVSNLTLNGKAVEATTTK